MPVAAASEVTLNGVGSRFGDHAVLTNVSHTFQPGVTVILGPNGAGKTTLFRLITGVLKPSEGVVTIDGLDPWTNSAARSRIGVVMHRPGLTTGLSVADYLEFWRRLLRVDTDRAQQIVDALRLDLLWASPVERLSRGQRQLVAMGRALLAEPTVLVLDEPTSGLDPAATDLVHRLVRSAADRGGCVLYSTHVLDEASAIGDQVLVVRDCTLSALCDTDDPTDHARLAIRTIGDPSAVLRSFDLSFEYRRPHWIVTLPRAQKKDLVAHLAETVGISELRDLTPRDEARSAYRGAHDDVTDSTLVAALGRRLIPEAKE